MRIYFIVLILSSSFLRNRLVVMWASNIEKGLLNGITLFDLRQFFDLVGTDILLKKLRNSLTKTL